MPPDVSRYVVGGVWAYRASDRASSEQVKIMAVIPGKQSGKAQISFVDDPQRPSETVSVRRLRVPWDEVAEFDVLMANWQRMEDIAFDEVEEACVSHVFEILVPPQIAELTWSHVQDALAIKDMAGLAEVVGMTPAEILATGQWFEHDGGNVLSRTGTLAIAEAACRRNPMPVLDWIIEQEMDLRHKCKHGSEHMGLSRKMEPTSPEWEYHWYLKWHRPRHELLRQWCGHRAVTFQERLIAAEAEARRLDLLVTDLIGALDRAGDKRLADYYGTEHERDRITPERARPIVDRPLDPSEIPVREVVRRRRWA